MFQPPQCTSLPFYSLSQLIFCAVLPHLYHNDDLALFEADSNSRSSCVLGCFVCGDDFQQLHSVNRGEVVHPNHLGRRKSSGLRQTLAPRVICYASQVSRCRGKQGCKTHYHHSALSIQPHTPLYPSPAEMLPNSLPSLAFPRTYHTPHSSCLSEDEGVTQDQECCSALFMLVNSLATKAVWESQSPGKSQALCELAGQPHAWVALLLSIESGTAATETDVDQSPCVLLVNDLFLGFHHKNLHWNNLPV